MKITGAAARRFLDKPDKTVRAVLLYGPNESFVHEAAETLARWALGKSDDPYAVTKLGDSEIKNLQTEVSCFRFSRQHDVFRFYIAMNHTGSVRRIEAFKYFADDFFCGSEWNVLFCLPVPVNPLAKGFTGEVFHNKVVLPVRFAHVINSNNVPVPDITSDQTFPNEALTR